MDQRKSFAIVMSNALRREGQGAASFMRELHELSDADKAWYTAALRAAGYEFDDPPMAVSAVPPVETTEN